MPAAPIDGHCDARFAAVRQAFSENFAARDELGAAVAIALDGRFVVDLWGGWADVARSKPWQRDTLVNFFSVGKALTSICVLRLVERRKLELDRPVAAYWPELGAGAQVTLRHILSHRAGLPAIRAPLPEDAMLDWDTMIAALERQSPWWPPGEDHGYHVNTFGYLTGELLRRVTGTTLGTYLRDEVAGPLAVDVHVGLATQHQARAADFLWQPLDVPPGDGAIGGDDQMRWQAYFNPAGISGTGWVNHQRWRSAEIPSTNGHGTARGVARLYAALAAGGAIDGVQLLSRAMLAEAVTEHSAGIDRVTQRPARFGLGFQLTQPERRLGPNAAAFGHFGAGGALGFCDPEAGVAFAYVMNQMGPRWQNPRNRALVEALYRSL
ncbi:MAG TPA: serine hydrolase domain-containing protein [Terriglobales bacterium]|nr:serine hydrolase domain-containing protein [Terriglobales bacterium]